MASGLVEISKNLQYINAETGAIKDSADSTKQQSEELIDIAKAMEDIITQYKSTG
jgi:methyl-accepting chemotaxis protein